MTPHSTDWSSLSRLRRGLYVLGAIGTLLACNALAAVFLTDDLGLLTAANMLVTPTRVMREVARTLVNNIKFAANVLRSYDNQYFAGGAKQGFTVNARLPQRFRVQKGTQLVPEAIVDHIVPITLTDQAHTGMEFSSASLTMEVEDYRKRYIDPAVDALVNTVDFDGLSRMYLETYHTVGTPAVVPATTSANPTYLAAGVKLDNAGVPMDGRVAMLSSGMHAGLANANLTAFNPAQYIGEVFRKGQFAKEALGISEWYKTQNVATHVVGPLGGTPLVNLAGQTGSSINTKGWTSSAARRLNKGDVIQIDGVFAINPQSYQSTGALQDFVVTANVDSDGSGDAAVPISPEIIITGAFQTVSAAPADEAVITIFGHASSHADKSTPQGLVYHPEAYAMVMADLELPGGLWVAERLSNKALNVSIRFLKAHDIMSDMSPGRLDTLYGWKAVRAGLGARVCA